MSTSLDQIFEHDVKQNVLRTYVAMLQYKFKAMQNETNKETKDELEGEVYTLIETMLDLISKKDK